MFSSNRLMQSAKAKGFLGGWMVPRGQEGRHRNTPPFILAHVDRRFRHLPTNFASLPGQRTSHGTRMPSVDCRKAGWSTDVYQGIHILWIVSQKADIPARCEAVEWAQFFGTNDLASSRLRERFCLFGAKTVTDVESLFGNLSHAAYNYCRCSTSDIHGELTLSNTALFRFSITLRQVREDSLDTFWSCPTFVEFCCPLKCRKIF